MRNKYVVFASGKSYSWGLVTRATETEVQGTVHKGMPYTEEVFDIRVKDVVAVLGRRPPIGTAYGCYIEPWLYTVESPVWGDIHVFTKLDNETKTAVQKALGRAAAKLKSAGLTGFLPIDIEIRAPKGKYAGKYHWFSSPEKRDRMILHPADWSTGLYIVLHESAHGIWFNLMSKKQRAQWIALYHSYLTVTACDAETVRGLRDDFTGQSGEHVKDFRGQLAEDVAPVFDLCIEHVTSYHGLSVTNVDALIDADSGALLKPMWPTSKVLKTDYEYPISEYAMKSPEEFFAEAFGYHMSGTKIPKKVLALLETTLQRVAGRKPRG